MAKKRNRITSEMSKIIGETSPFVKQVPSSFENKDEENTIINVDLHKLVTNPYQPRINIDEKSLEELISSIEQNGLLQPIVITEEKNDFFTIIAGHRRFEAFKIIGKNTIKATIMKDITDKDLAILSLTENLVRENLHPIENAIAIKNILNNNIVESQNKLAVYVGLSKGHISKLMNILKLPSSFISKIKEENYKDINILVLLNKINNITLIEEAFENIKNLSRSEAEKYLKLNYLSIENKELQHVDIGISKTKINLNIQFKNLDDNQKNEIINKISLLKNEIELIINGNK